MGIEAQYITIPFILVAFAVLALTVVAWRRSLSPGSLIFSLMMVMVAVWLISATFEDTASTVTGKILAAKTGYLGISWAAALWLAFALEFVFPDRHYFRRFWPWLCVVPLANIAAVMTNELHGLVWKSIIPSTTGNGLSLVYEHGWWFWGFVAYSYLALVTGLCVLLVGMRRFSPGQRDQAVGIIAGMVFPWAANILYIAGVTPKPGLDITPFAFTLTGVLYAWTLFRLKLFDTAFQAHEFILENMEEGYLFVDSGDRIGEVNCLACEYLGLDQPSVLGKRPAAALDRWPDLLDLLYSLIQAPVEIMVEGEPPRYLEANLMDWYINGEKIGGRIIILHDITRRRKAEESLRESERLYRLVVNTMPVGIALTDDVGRVTFASPKLSEIYGTASSAEITGQTLLRWFHQDDRSLGLMRLLKVIEEKENLPPQECRLVRPDGTIFWGEVISTPLVDDQDTSKGMLAIIRDVSQRKTLEFRLQRNLEQQTFINNLLQILYRPHDLLMAMSQVLEETGQFTKANRVYLCKDSADGTETSIVLEWSSIGISSRARESALFRYKEMPTWRDCMADRGMVLAPEMGSAPPDIAEYMDAWNIMSLAVFPIYGTEERLYGFLGLDNCEEAYNWTEDDLGILWNVCRVVSGAVAQRQIEEAEHRQHILAEVLHDTASALNSTLNFEEVLDRILVNLEQIVRHNSASIALVDEEGFVNFVRWRGYDPSGDSLMQNTRLPLTERETYRLMAETGSPIIIPDTSMDKRWMHHPAYDWIRSYAGMPIQIKGKIAGFINLDNSEPDSFKPDLAYSLHVFADQAAVAIENARLYDAARRRAEEMSILNRIGLTITAGLEMNQILVSLFEQCRQVLPVDVFYVALYDAENHKIELPLYCDEGRFEQVGSRDMQTHPGVTSEVIRQRRTIYLPDTLSPEVERDYQVVRVGGKLSRSYVGVPLILLNQVVGVISMQSYRPHAYTIEQVRLLETIAIQTAIAVQNARLFEQMKQLAITDSVTRLFTRRHFTTLGRSEVERALRYNRKLSVLMIDIDHFKSINDTFGHTVGDQMLLNVANICRQALRATDIVGRWGGEEYVIILPEADKDGAGLIAERIRRMVSEMEILVGQEAAKVTISIGVAALTDSCHTLETLVDSADRALYAAKQAGRNQVSLGED